MEKSAETSGKILSRWWLIIGVISLAIAGLYAVPLAGMRSPAVKASETLTRLFRDALVVHVDLSVLVWFLAVACMMWSLISRNSKPVLPYIEHAALLCFAAGTLFIALSPLDPASQPLMSNYIPVVYSPVFFLGLSFIFCGVGLMLVQLLFARPLSNEFPPALRFGLITAGVIAAASIAAFLYSGLTLPHGFDLTYHYELLFWAGGHLLQFTHLQILLVAWVLLMSALRPAAIISSKYLYAIFSIGLLAVLAAPIGYIVGDVTSYEHKQFFTTHMIHLGGLAPTILAFWVIATLWKARETKHGVQGALWSSLLMSLSLFLYGGLLGLLIQGQNVTIPAHYHGSIVGVTLGFMGLAYLLMPRLGYRDPAGWRLAFWQPIVYGIGQVMHVSGLAWSGGYGVLRKTPGGLENAPLDVKAAMGFMGLGGLLAIIGGLMFVIVAYRSISNRKA
ncbi:MAG: hypothetical protein SFT92_05855 [Rickettsiales bacterium]|nr:hypothetical protein [Rickettsiales bacterium]